MKKAFNYLKKYLAKQRILASKFLYNYLVNPIVRASKFLYKKYREIDYVYLKKNIRLALKIKNVLKTFLLIALLVLLKKHLGISGEHFEIACVFLIENIEGVLIIIIAWILSFLFKKPLKVRYAHLKKQIEDILITLIVGCTLLLAVLLINNYFFGDTSWVSDISSGIDLKTQQTYKGLLTIIGGLAIILGVAVGLRRANAFEQQNKNDTYAKAIELLGHDKEATQTGAVYTLHRMVKNDADYKEQVLEVLCGFVRAETKQDWEKATDQKKAEAEGQFLFQPKDKDPSLPVQTVLDVIFNTKKDLNAIGENSIYENKIADLFSVFIDKAHLYAAQMQSAILTGSFLREANMMKANLKYTNFIGADLTGAILSLANLTEPIFKATNLTKVNFQHAYLHNTDFTKTNFTGAKFARAFLYKVQGLKKVEVTITNISNLLERFGAAVYYETALPTSVDTDQLTAYKEWLEKNHNLILEHSGRTYTTEEPIPYECWMAVQRELAYRQYLKQLIERLSQQDEDKDENKN